MDSPEQVIEGWQQAWNAGDADGLAALFVSDAEFVNAVGLWWHNRDDIRAAHAFGLATILPRSTITMGRPRVRRVGPDAAIVQARWHLAGQVNPTDAPAGERAGAFTFVLEHRTDGWITVAAHNTDTVPGAQTHLNTGSQQAPAYYRAPPARGWPIADRPGPGTNVRLVGGAAGTSQRDGVLGDVTLD